MPFRPTRDSMFLFFLGTFLFISLIGSEKISAQPVLQVLEDHTEASLFLGFIEKAELEEQLNSDGPYTIFVPTNSALQSLEDRLNRSSGSALRSFVLNHVMTGMATRRHMSVMSKAPSMGGLVLQMTVQDDERITVNNVYVTQFNIRAENGVIHIIDGVLEN